MVNEEILGGLKSALERGHSLERAMISLFNAGYKRKEIEEAAVALLESRPSLQVQTQAELAQEKERIKSPPPDMTAQIRAKSAPELQAPSAQVPMPPPSMPKPTLVQKPIQPQKPLERSVQRISSYGRVEPKESSKEKGIIIVLIILLVLLVGLFAAIFLYRQQFIDFLNSFFG
jgi:hypothetical protein